MMLRLLPDWLLTRWYYVTGTRLGDALSYAPSLGFCISFDRLEARFIALEQEYDRRGYKVVPISNFIDYGGGYVAELKGTNLRLEPGETNVLFS